ncbi:ERMES complex subunit [Martiniozyma asiatica (nom. inval.)]|nr:ERMES complex subunit [Martiniozyma asiatica]
MSFIINWEKLSQDRALNDGLKQFLNEKLETVELPDYLANLHVVDFQLGDVSPELTIRDINVPFPEFYTNEIIEEDNSWIRPPVADVEMRSNSTPAIPNYLRLGTRTNSQMGVGLGTMNYHQTPSATATATGTNLYGSQTPPPLSPPIMSSSTGKKAHEPNATDMQLSMDLNWDSALYIEVTCDLLVNYPAPEFIRLPVRLKITDLKIHSLLVVAYVNPKVFISFLCDIDSSSHSERLDVLKDIKITGELGSPELPLAVEDAAVLRNIGQVESFLTRAIRNLVVSEMGWPSWIELDFSDDDDMSSQESAI